MLARPGNAILGVSIGPSNCARPCKGAPTAEVGFGKRDSIGAGGASVGLGKGLSRGGSSVCANVLGQTVLPVIAVMAKIHHHSFFEGFLFFLFMTLLYSSRACAKRSQPILRRVLITQLCDRAHLISIHICKNTLA